MNLWTTFKKTAKYLKMEHNYIDENTIISIHEKNYIKSEELFLSTGQSTHIKLFNIFTLFLGM